MPRFTNTEYKNIIENLIEASNDKIKNPYYLYTDKKGTIVDYYAQNKEQSTLDPASKLNYSKLGEQSPFKYNYIKDFIMYGIDRISLSIDEGDMGTEGSAIEGEVIVLPNSIEPAPGDYFVIKYIKEDALFQITGVHYDTLDTGANIYRLEYKLMYIDSSKVEALKSQVVKEFNYIATTVGSDFKQVVESTDYELIKELEILIERMTGFYKDLFFDDPVQTFTYKINGEALVYDPYFIEFLIRNRIFMEHTDKYTFVTHQLKMDKMFNVNYHRCFFYSIEEKNRTDLHATIYANLRGITDPNTLFNARSYTYYETVYMSDYIFGNLTEIFSPELIEHIEQDTYFEADDPLRIYNLLIAYFNNREDYIKANLMDLLNSYVYNYSPECFYGMPISIFIIIGYIKKLMRQL